MVSSFKYRFKREYDFARVSVERKPNINEFLFYWECLEIEKFANIVQIPQIV